MGDDNPFDVTSSGGGGGGSPAGSKSSPSKKKGGSAWWKGAIGKAAIRDLRDILTAIPHLPKAIVREAAETANILVPGSQIIPQSIPAVRKWIGPMEAPGQSAAQAVKKISQGKIKTGLTELLEAPGVRLVPGSFVSSQALRGNAPTERPIMSLLDVLPYVGKASRVATRGTQMAERATTRATQLGKTAKAERIAQRGLDPRQLVHELARTGETKFVTRNFDPATKAVIRANPGVLPSTPSWYLEASGLGGERLRQFVRFWAQGDRALANQARAVVDDVMGQSKIFNVEPARIQQISQAYELGKLNWKAEIGLKPNEQQWLDVLETRKNEFTQEQVNAGRLFEYGGEIYPRKTNGALYRAKYKIHQAEEELAKPIEGVSKTRAQQRYNAAIQEAEKVASKQIADRWKPVLAEQARETISKAAPELDEIQIGEATRAYLSGNYRAAAQTLKMPESAVRELRKLIPKVEDLQKQGFDPRYLHHVTPEGGEQLLLRPKLTRQVKDPEFTQLRSMNLAPSVPDLEIGISAMGVEALRPVLARGVWHKLREQRFLLTREEAVKDLTPFIRRDILRGVPEPIATDKWLKRTYGEMNPDSFFPGIKHGIQAGADTMYLPKGLHRALLGKKIGLAAQADLGKFAKVSGVPMNVFRTSILTLNPSYYAGNFVSGAYMVAAHNPRAVLRLGSAVRRVLRGEIPEGLSVGQRISTAEQAQQLGRFKTGQEVANILTRADQVRGVPSALRKVGQSVVRVPGWLNKASSFIDDAWKVTAFLDESRKALKKGMSPKAAEQAGIDLAHRILVDLDRMTPLERTAVRSVFPFAGWTSHLLRYTLNYPFDHPWRAAIVSSLSRNLNEEWPEGLPERFKGDLMFAGDTKRLAIGNYIPSLTVPDIFSASGILSRLNPMLQSLMEYSGSDPYTMSESVYGARNTEYNPVSGREEAVRPSLVRKATELSPQVRQILNWITQDPEWKEYVKDNPEAAHAAAWRAFGIPIPRDVDLKKEIEKAEKARARVASKNKEEEPETVATSSTPSGGGNPWDVTTP